MFSAVDHDRHHPHEDHDTARWRELLSGENSGLRTMERVFRKFPSPPRCKLCQAPFSGPWAPLFRLAGFRRWNLNQQLCKWCIGSIEDQTGGAEIPVSLLYSDLRGSTELAEQLGPSEFTRLLNRFYSRVSEAVDAESGVIDHMAGDGVFAIWIPAFVDGPHAPRAVAAGRRLVADLEAEHKKGLDIPAGVAVHTGVAFVGVVGELGSKDFTALGDPVNTVARLASEAGPGELVLSNAIAVAAGVDTTSLSHQYYELKGKAEPFPAWVQLAP